MKQIWIFLSLLLITSTCGANTMKHVALIFDDGPTPTLNSQYLKFFKQAAITVTFAQVAQHVIDYTDCSKATLVAGHEIVNHSYNHQHPVDLSDDELKKEIGGAQRVFIENLNYTPKWYWAPFLEIDDRVIAETKKANVPVYQRHHLVVSHDYNTSVSAKEIHTFATTGVQDGSIILFHEWREETLSQLPNIINTLIKQGCVFMTLSELNAYVEKHFITTPTNEKTIN